MLRLGILGLGLVAAMVVFDCGGRTPLQDEDLFGNPGSTVTSGASGTPSPTTGAGGTSVGIGPGGGVAGDLSGGGGGSGIAGATGFAGNGFGTGGSVNVGTGGTPGFGGTGAAGSTGLAGSVGTGGSFVGVGGATGAAGSASPPMLVRGLINELPGTRASAACIACASMCEASAACAANSACTMGLACAVANCEMRNGNPGIACLAKCTGGDPASFRQAIGALTCVYGTCGASCAGRMR